MSLRLWKERRLRWLHSKRSSEPYVVKLGGTIHLRGGINEPTPTLRGAWRMLWRALLGYIGKRES